MPFLIAILRFHLYLISSLCTRSHQLHSQSVLASCSAQTIWRDVFDSIVYAMHDVKTALLKSLPQYASPGALCIRSSSCRLVWAC